MSHTEAQTPRKAGRQRSKTISKRHIEILSMYESIGAYEPIAAELKLPIGTVKSRLHRARAKVAEMSAQEAGAV